MIQGQFYAWSEIKLFACKTMTIEKFVHVQKDKVKIITKKPKGNKITNCYLRYVTSICKTELTWICLTLTLTFL